jgi:phosphoglycerol transferase MdoB-like AlkP superfamily enzyme
VAFAIIAAGRFATSKVDAGGLDRNAFGALWPVEVPSKSEDSAFQDWRATSTPVLGSNNPSQYRGAAAGRNIVLVMLESTGARYLKSYGASTDPMPHLTALADRGLLFENAFAVYPESIKGLFSVLCSRYPAFGIPADDYDRVPCPSIAGQLRNAGYRTALFHSGRFMYLGMRSVIENRGFELLEDAGAIGGNLFSPETTAKLSDSTMGTWATHNSSTMRTCTCRT